MQAQPKRIRYRYWFGPCDPSCRTARLMGDRKSTRLNSSHSQISYAVFCLKKKMQFVPSIPFAAAMNRMLFNERLESFPCRDGFRGISVEAFIQIGLVVDHLNREVDARVFR